MSKIAFLPGTLCTNAIFNDAMAALTADGHQCLDVRYDQADSLSAMADAVLQASQGQACYLAAFSMGGMVAFELLRHHPDKIKGVMLIASNAHADKPGGEQARAEHLALAQEKGLEWVLRQYYLPKYQARPTPESEQQIIQMAETIGLAGYQAQLQVLAERPDSYQTLAEAEVPFLLLSGQQDPLCPPEEQQRMADAASQVAQVLLEDAGHFVSLDQPQAVTAVLRHWMEEHDG